MVRKINVLDLDEIKPVNHQEATHTETVEPIEDVIPETILEDESQPVEYYKPLHKPKEDEPYPKGKLHQLTADELKLKKNELKSACPFVIK